MRLTRSAACAAMALLLVVALARAAEYSCPGTCQSNLGCQCATSTPPGGLANGNVPQFIVLTNDDAITIVSQPMILNITERHANKNGCKMPATWYVSVDYTDPNLVKQVYIRGHEIATHTLHHVANPNASEIVGARDWLNETAGIPKEKIGGFRAPYLIFNEQQRGILQKNGFWFDSSISEQYPSKTSTSAAERLWPYTMDYGVPQDCAISTGTCSLTERHPGLWEFPMWNIQDGTGVTVASMDPLGDAYELYKREFDQRYQGNRAPLGIYIHAAWLIADNSRADRLNQFLQYAMTHDDVFLVTVSQVLDWMKNPVPASDYSPTCPSAEEMAAQLPEGTTLCVLPDGGCEHGTFDSSTCKCACQNQDINAAGYCRDPVSGRCTVQKDYNFDTKDYFCPAPTAAPTAAAPSTAPAAAPSAGAGAGSGSPIKSEPQPLTVEIDVSGTTPAELEEKMEELCAQLLRLTGDPAATCTLVSMATLTSRRLLQDKVHVIIAIETRNAEAAVAALKTDTLYSLLSPTGLTVIPGSVKASLGAPVVPEPTTPEPSESTDGTDGTVEPSTDGTIDEPAESSTDAAAEGDSEEGGGSNTGLIVGAVVGVLAGVGILGGGAFWYMRRRRTQAAEGAAAEAMPTHTSSFNPTFHTGGVTANVMSSRSPTKKQQLEGPVSQSPLRDSMVRATSQPTSQ